jgi:iron complex transport system ATP-binding protein
MGQMWPTHGEVCVLGQAFGQTDLNELRESIRLVQATGPVEFDADETAIRVVLTGFFGTIGLFKETTPAMRQRAAQLIRQVGLAKEAQQPFRTLSSGERMRCLIARALVVKPKLLILDEPTAGLDLLAREQVLATVHHLLKQSKMPPTVILITHHVEELLPETSEVLLLKDGRAFASGSAAKMITSKQMSAVYDCAVKVTRREGRFWWQVRSAAWKRI